MARRPGRTGTDKWLIMSLTTAGRLWVRCLLAGQRSKNSRGARTDAIFGCIGAYVAD